MVLELYPTVTMETRYQGVYFMCVCVCVCERDRERERDDVWVNVEGGAAGART